jgi:hypothetical protein
MKNLISSASIKSVLISAENENTNLKGGEFTIESKKTGKDFTYKVLTKPYNGREYTHVYIESEYLKFKHIGTYKYGNIYKKGERVLTPGATAISYVLDKVQKNKIDALDEQLNTYHLGSCLKCGRTLTDANSIKTGIGPVCGHK